MPRHDPDDPSRIPPEERYDLPQPRDEGGYHYGGQEPYTPNEHRHEETEPTYNEMDPLTIGVMNGIFPNHFINMQAYLGANRGNVGAMRASGNKADSGQEYNQGEQGLDSMFSGYTKPTGEKGKEAPGSAPAADSQGSGQSEQANTQPQGGYTFTPGTAEPAGPFDGMRQQQRGVYAN